MTISYEAMNYELLFSLKKIEFIIGCPKLFNRFFDLKLTNTQTKTNGHLASLRLLWYFEPTALFIDIKIRCYIRIQNKTSLILFGHFDKFGISLPSLTKVKLLSI